MSSTGSSPWRQPRSNSSLHNHNLNTSNNGGGGGSIQSHSTFPATMHLSPPHNTIPNSLTIATGGESGATVPVTFDGYGEIDLEGILNNLPSIRTKSIHSVIIPLARQVSLFFSLCTFSQQQQQQQQSENDAMKTKMVIQFLTSGSASSVANQMFTSVDNMCQIVQMLENTCSSETATTVAAVRGGYDVTQMHGAPIGKYAVKKLCDSSVHSARVLCHLIETGGKTLGKSGNSTGQLDKTQTNTNNSSSSSSSQSNAFIECLMQSVSQESFNILISLCQLLNTADYYKLLSIFNTHDKVFSVLAHMETVTSFQEFVRCFGEFGSHMVELAQSSGERQNDLMSECCSSKLSCCRAVLEKTTMMLLTSSKTLLRHPECNSAQRTRDSVYDLIKSTLNSFRQCVTGYCIDYSTGSYDNQQQLKNNTSTSSVVHRRCEEGKSASIQQLLKEINCILCDCHLTESISQWTLSKLLNVIGLIKYQFDQLTGESNNKNTAEDGTAAAAATSEGVTAVNTANSKSSSMPPLTCSISDEDKGHINNALGQLMYTCQTFSPSAVLSGNTNNNNNSYDTILQKFSATFSSNLDNFIKSLHSSVLNQSAISLTTQNDITQSLHLFKQAASGQLGEVMKNSAAFINSTQGGRLSNQKSGSGGASGSASSSNNDSFLAVEAESLKFQSFADQYQSLCRLLYHVCETTRFRILVENCESCIRFYSHQLVLSAQTAALYPSSKIANENLTVFIDAWNYQLQEFSMLTKDIVDNITNNTKPPLDFIFMNGASSVAAIGGPLGAKMTLGVTNFSRTIKFGLDLKRVASLMENEIDLLHSSLEAEELLSSPQLSPEKSTCTDIMKRCRNLCSMAFALYLFSRKEGPLKSTYDFFTQVQFFVQEGSKIHSLINEKSHQLISLANGGQIQSVTSAASMSLVGNNQSSTSETSTELKNLIKRIAEIVDNINGLVSQYQFQNHVSTSKVESCFQEIIVLMWELFTLVRYYLQAIYLTHLPNYNWPINIPSASSPNVVNIPPNVSQLGQFLNTIPPNQHSYSSQNMFIPQQNPNMISHNLNMMSLQQHPNISSQTSNISPPHNNYNVSQNPNLQTLQNSSPNRDTQYSNNMSQNYDSGNHQNQYIAGGNLGTGLESNTGAVNFMHPSNNVNLSMWGVGNTQNPPSMLNAASNMNICSNQQYVSSNAAINDIRSSGGSFNSSAGITAGNINYSKQFIAPISGSNPAVSSFAAISTGIDSLKKTSSLFDRM